MAEMKKDRSVFQTGRKEGILEAELLLFGTNEKHPMEFSSSDVVKMHWCPAGGTEVQANIPLKQVDDILNGIRAIKVWEFCKNEGDEKKFILLKAEPKPMKSKRRGEEILHYTIEIGYDTSRKVPGYYLSMMNWFAPESDPMKGERYGKQLALTSWEISSMFGEIERQLMDRTSKKNGLYGDYMFTLN